MRSPFSDGLDVGDVAGLIGGGISLVHTTAPLLAALIVVAVLSRGNHNAATWSVGSRQIQGSLWPTILAGDSAAARHVRKDVVVCSLLVTTSSLVLVLAHFFTPLPLVAEIVTDMTLKEVSFAYIPDESFYGQGTPTRTSKSINRLCQGPPPKDTWVSCPHSKYTPHGPDLYYGQLIVNTTIPEKTSKSFSSGTTNSTVCGPMDMQFRNYFSQLDNYIDGGAPQERGGFLPFETFLLDDDYRLVEGLIVDPVGGGIGLRNHTLPIDLELGATWTEDILWIEPHSSCTNTNLTFGFEIPSFRFDYGSFSDNVIRATLKDDGGFSDLPSEPPGPSWLLSSESVPTWNNSPPVPDLLGRSSQLAYWNNYLTRLALDISDPLPQTVYYKDNSFYNYASQYRFPSALEISPMDGSFLNSSLFSNKSGLEQADYALFGDYCSGYERLRIVGDNVKLNEWDAISSMKPYIICGYLYGMPRPALPGQSWKFDLGTNWTQSLYTCSSALRASVKTVQFRSSGSSSLTDLQVVNVTDKLYHDSSAEPLWAVEKVKGFNTYGINLFWGIVSDAFKDDPDMFVRRSSTFYLPITTQAAQLGYSYDGFAAGNVFQMTWNSVYNEAARLSNVGLSGVPPYSGDSNFALSLKYRALSNSSEGAAKLLNLIWTDLAAFSVIGTKHGFEYQTKQSPHLKSRSSDQSAQIPLGTRSVYVHKRVVKYSNLLYAIPAIFVAVIWLFLFVSVVVLCCGARIRWRSLHNLVNQTSMGRVATNEMVLSDYDSKAKTKIWLDRAGTIQLRLPLDDHIPRNSRLRPNATFFKRKVSDNVSSSTGFEALRNDDPAISTSSMTIELPDSYGGGGGGEGGELGMRNRDQHNYPFTPDPHVNAEQTAYFQSVAQTPDDHQPRLLQEQGALPELSSTKDKELSRFGSLHGHGATVERPKPVTGSGSSPEIHWRSPGGQDESQETLL